MLTRKEKVVVFSPLVLFLFYVLFLFSLHDRPFLLRWIDGSFGLFAALVACNLLRRALLGSPPPTEDGENGES